MEDSLGDDVYGHFDELPCEFCPESFPLVLLYEHQLVCANNPNVGEPASEIVEEEHSNSPKNSSSNIGIVISQSVLAEVNTQKEALVKSPAPSKSPTNQPSKGRPKSPAHTTVSKPTVAPSAVEKGLEISMSEKIKRDFKSNNILNDILAHEQSTLTFEDSVMEERAPKLMAFGDQNKMRFEEEKPSFKMPLLPHLTKSESRDLDYLSDSEDAPESLEDFWKRAEIKVSQQLNQVIKL